MASSAPGTTRAFQEFFAAHYTDLAQLARRLTGETDAADDLAAETLLQLWQHWDRVTGADNPLAYARGVVAVLVRNRLRRLLRERHCLERHCLTSIGSAGSVVLGRQESSDVDAVLDVRDALRRMPRGRRACVLLRYGHGLSEAETADVLGISVGTVKSQTSRGADQLARLLHIS
jgi:RNA polymerase sigma-70 factor (sigma-E family)